MKISDKLDEKEAENIDVSLITLPSNMSYDEDPDETIFFKDMNPCGFFCTENHPFATVERFGHWYFSTGQDKKEINCRWCWEEMSGQSITMNDVQFTSSLKIILWWSLLLINFDKSLREGARRYEHSSHLP